MAGRRLGPKATFEVENAWIPSALRSLLPLTNRPTWTLAVIWLMVACPSIGTHILATRMENFDNSRPAKHAIRQVLSGDDLRALLVSGEAVQLADVDVSGDLDLVGVDNVSRPFACSRCEFEGEFRAPNVRFSRLVDLSGSHFHRPADFTGAVFEAGLLFRTSNDQRVTFDGKVDFSQATVLQGASFEDAIFNSQASFDAVRFGGDASFADADFHQAAVFDSAHFDSQAILSGALAEDGPRTGTFFDAVSFKRSTFKGLADFHQRRFAGAASFDGALIHSADFTQSEFAKASFAGASFDDRAVFIAAQFNGYASFLQASSGASLQFDFARFRSGASFFRLTTFGPFTLKQATFEGPVMMNQLSVGSLLMDVSDVQRIDSKPIQKEILSLIEKTARNTGDLSTANDAKYQLLVLRSGDLAWPWRGFDTIFYRLGGGYFVRPANPLIALAVLVLVASLIRAAHLARSAPPSQPKPRRRRRRRTLSRRFTIGLAQTVEPPNQNSKADRGHGPVQALVLNVEKATAVVLGEIGESVSRCFSKKPALQIKDSERTEVAAYAVAGLVLLEFLASKALIFAFALGLANSNATLRQMLDSIL
jgi:uncharacterized protein YjbI with pentapeptide repeats